MKTNLAIIAVLVSTFAAAPAFAQDWDMTPDANTQPAQLASIQSTFAGAQTAGSDSMGFDTSAMTPVTPTNDQVNENGYIDQDYSQLQNVQSTTTNQNLPSLPECRVHTLAVVRGPVDKKTGLPPCTLSSFVKDAGKNAFFIYGDEGGFDEQGHPGGNGRPPLKNFLTINQGISGATAAGLTTGYEN